MASDLRTGCAACFRVLLATLAAFTLAAPALGGGGPIIVNSIGESGDTPTPSDNDFTRINDAIQAAGSGETIRLQGTFDWTETNADASWALGSDGASATGDEYFLAVPPLDDLTITADSLGEAVNKLHRKARPMKDLVRLLGLSAHYMETNSLSILVSESASSSTCFSVGRR